MRRAAVGSLVAALVFAAGTLPRLGASPESFAKVDALLKAGLFRNLEAVQALAVDLDEAEKRRLVDRYAQGGLGPAALDLAAGFGIGSALQGDWAGAAMAGAGELAGLTTLFVGLAFAENYAHGVGSFAGGDALMIGGAAFMAACRVFGLARSFWYADRYGRTLKIAFGLNP